MLVSAEGHRDGGDDSSSTSEPAPSEQGSPSSSEPGWQRRRRLAQMFGEVLPETTRDERDGEAPRDESAGDRWLREQVPPHHGG